MLAIRCTRSSALLIGDLALWYGFPILQFQKVEWGGDPVPVTHDTALTNLFFRMLPPMWGSENDKAIRFSPAFVELPDDWLKWDELIQSVNLSSTLPSSEDRLRRLQNLFSVARGCCTCDEERDGRHLANLD